MPLAARIGDLTSHPGVLGPTGGVMTVLIEGLPAAVVGTTHTCSFPGTPPHPPNAVIPPGSKTVLIGGLPAARMGDACGCTATIAKACLTVEIGG